MYEGYLTLAGVELVNNERTAVYARNLGITTINCPPCTIAAAVGDSPYTTPAADSAPWYDAAAPESAGFAGFFGLDVKGYSTSPITRSPLERLSDGAVITRTRYKHREVQYTGVMLAKDRCSLSYGLAWLSTALRGSTCSPCGGTDACAYTCCPTPDNVDDALRTMVQVGVLEGPVTARMANLRSTCGTGADVPIIAEVSFTLALGRPWLYRAPITVRSGHLTRPAGACEDHTWQWVVSSYATWNALMAVYPTWASLAGCVIWNPPGECPREGDDYDEWGCPRPVSRDCAQDPLRPQGCPEPPAPPTVPRPYDPCAICYDGPNTMTGVLNVPPSATPSWLDQVPVIDITTGPTPVRALLIRFYSNPTGQQSFCNVATLDPCTACATIAVPYVPAGATLSIDGRDFTAALDCDGGRGTAVIDDSTGIYGPGGQPYTWPVFDCNGFCISLTVPCDFPLDEVTVNVAVVAREDAA